MSKSDRRRIVREYCASLKRQLLKNIEVFPDSWDGCHIRALAAYLQDMKQQPDRLSMRLEAAHTCGGRVGRTEKGDWR
jgi:hypothetical protein